MIDTSQILIVAAITVMTVLLTIIGIQLIFILRDVRQIVKRANTMSAELEKLGLNISGSYNEVIGFVSSVRKLFHIAEYVSDRKKTK